MYDLFINPQRWCDSVTALNASVIYQKKKYIFTNTHNTLLCEFSQNVQTHTHTHANYLFLLSFGYNGDSARPRLPASFVCAVTLYVVNLRRPGFESFTFDHTEGVAFDRNNNDNTHTHGSPTSSLEEAVWQNSPVACPRTVKSFPCGYIVAQCRHTASYPSFVPCRNVAFSAIRGSFAEWPFDSFEGMVVGTKVEFGAVDSFDARWMNSIIFDVVMLCVFADGCWN